MCSANVRNEPPYDPPTPTRPRTYVLSGSVPPARVAASVALATLGTLLSEAESLLADAYNDYPSDRQRLRVYVLREARDAVARAEAEYADGTVRG